MIHYARAPSSPFPYSVRVFYPLPFPNHKVFFTSFPQNSELRVTSVFQVFFTSFPKWSKVFPTNFIWMLSHSFPLSISLYDYVVWFSISHNLPPFSITPPPPIPTNMGYQPSSAWGKSCQIPLWNSHTYVHITN